MACTEVKVAEEDDEKCLTLESVFSKSFKLLFSLFGISFGGKRSVKSYLFFFFYFFKRLFESYAYLISHIERKQNFFAIASEQCLALFPILELSYIFFNLPRLNGLLDEYFVRNNLLKLQCVRFVRSSRMRTLFASLAICIMYIVIVTIAFTAVPIEKMSQEELVRRHIPFGIRFGGKFDWIVVMLCFAHEQITFLYIPISSSLYLAYFFILMHLKKTVVTMINPSRVETLLQQLDELEEIQVALDSTLSIMPLDWLAYGIGAGLVYILIVSSQWGDGVVSIVIPLYHSVNILLIVVCLFVISKEQEKIESSIDFLKKATWRRFNPSAAVRVREVINHRVTVCNIFPIDRSLILAYIGSAITFSTLIMQISK